MTKCIMNYHLFHSSTSGASFKYNNLWPLIIFQYACSCISASPHPWDFFFQISIFLGFNCFHLSSEILRIKNIKTVSFLWRMTWSGWLICKSLCIITLIFLLFPFIYCVCWQAYYYVHLFFRVFHHCPRLIISRKKVEMFVTSFLVRFDLKFWILGSTKFQAYQKCFLFIICFGFFCTSITELIKCLIPTEWQVFLFVLTFSHC